MTNNTGSRKTGGEAPLLSGRHLTKTFQNSNKRSFNACDDVSFEVYPGETLGIVGESGSGKSTLMRMLVGLSEPTGGEMIFLGKDLGAIKGKDAREMRRHIQMIFQDPGTAFDPRMKIRDIICEPLLNYRLIDKKLKDETAEKFLHMVELPAGFKDRYPQQLSGGQRQRVGIARALTLEPELIICDEVTSALDVSVQKNVLDLLKRLQKEKGVAYLFICHDLAVVEEMADRILVMNQGKIVERLPGTNIRKAAKEPYTRKLIDSVFEPKSAIANRQNRQTDI